MNTGGLAGYQQSVISLLKQYYPDVNRRFTPSTWKTIYRFYIFHLIRMILYQAKWLPRFCKFLNRKPCIFRLLVLA